MFELVAEYKASRKMHEEVNDLDPVLVLPADNRGQVK